MQIICVLLFSMSGLSCYRLVNGDSALVRQTMCQKVKTTINNVKIHFKFLKKFLSKQMWLYSFKRGQINKKKSSMGRVALQEVVQTNQQTYA